MTYQQWQTNDGKVEKVTINSTVLAAFNEMKKKLKDFLLHSYIKCKQSAHMDSLKAKCDTQDIVLQVNFSENAIIASQHEIQSAHWNHGQAILFTAHAWVNECENQSFAIISDELTHTKECLCFLWIIF